MPMPRQGPAAGTMSLVLRRPPRAPRSHPVKPGGKPPGWKKAPWRLESQPEHRERRDRTKRGAPRGATRHAREARRRPQPRHTDRCQATTAAGCREPGERAQHATNHGTGTGAKQHQPPSGRTSARPEGTQPLPATEQPPSGRTSARPEGTQPLPVMNSRRPDGRVRARRVPSPCRLRTTAVRMDECAPGGYPAPAGYEQPTSRRTSERPAATPRTATPHAQAKAQHTERTHR